MSIINTIIFGKSKLIQDGLQALLREEQEIEVIDNIGEEYRLLDKLQQTTTHIVIYVINVFTEDTTVIIKNISNLYPRLRILVVSMTDSREVIYNTIKSGAKGFLTQDCSKEELIEAIFTIRFGYDYYSKSLSRILINDLLESTDSKDREMARSLSPREIEILKLWGSGLTNKEIAEKLFISIRTVETHKNHIMKKINLKTTVDLLKFAIRNKIVEI